MKKLFLLLVILFVFIFSCQFDYENEVKIEDQIVAENKVIGDDWGQVANRTGVWILVYKTRYKNDPYSPEDRYLLQPGKTTQNGWDCDGFYLPNNVEGLNTGYYIMSIPNKAIKIRNGQYTSVRRVVFPNRIRYEYTNGYNSYNNFGWGVPNCSESQVRYQIIKGIAPTN